MEKALLSKVAIIIGRVNWIIVGIGLAFFITFNIRTTTAVSLFFTYYLLYSFVPAVLSLGLIVFADKRVRAVNLAINLIFLLLYCLAFAFGRYMSMHG